MVFVSFDDWITTSSVFCVLKPGELSNFRATATWVGVLHEHRHTNVIPTAVAQCILWCCLRCRFVFSDATGRKFWCCRKSPIESSTKTRRAIYASFNCGRIRGAVVSPICLQFRRCLQVFVDPLFHGMVYTLQIAAE